MKAYTEFISQTILIIVAVGSFCYYLTLLFDFIYLSLEGPV